MSDLPRPILTDRFYRAFEFAGITHASQTRKGTSIPYLAHLMGVTSLVLEHGADEDVEEQQPISKPAGSTNQYFNMPVGSHGWVSAYLQQSKGRAGVYLRFEKGAIGDRLFAALAANRAEIDSALGLPVEWRQANDKPRTVIASKSFPGVLLEDCREATQAWLADAVPRFVAVFRPRIDALLRERG